ncbi:hypothetical protein COPCOM_00196 [Coprococcus comes ATCC 27758]|uniref:Uncharacterized protein n=1 Tax=Coprococcus comes ATCC 27758 TaxID=470146 RepID=C0B4X5_9FIRM|nr:hypothetical protein COPCOM_00196 [Coprococcus comes ATCC 27758]
MLLRLIFFVISFFVFFLRRNSFAVSLDLKIVYHIYYRKSIL